jgi:hypothetical protein
MQTKNKIDAAKFKKILENVKEMNDLQLTKLLNEIRERIFIPIVKLKEEVEDAHEVRFIDEEWSVFMKDASYEIANTVYKKSLDWEIECEIITKMGKKSCYTET